MRSRARRIVVRPKPVSPSALVFNIRQLADVLGISRPTAYTLITSGQVKGVRVGKNWRVPQAEVARLLEGR